MPIVLVGGGSRSGKSSYALRLAGERGVKLAFVATAQAWDDEMKQRIAKHRQERDARYTTMEEPLDIAELLRARSRDFDVIVVDCLTLWLSNLMHSETPDIEASSRKLIDTARVLPATVILVTNEVGCGIVPENALARRFRDHAGRLNQQVAAVADEVYWMVFGCPLKVR